MEFGAHSYIIHQPTWAEPWIVIDLHFYDTDGSDSFFLHKPAEGSTRGPAMYIDGVYIDSFDNELAWPNSDSDTEGTGNDKALNDERGHNSWWKGTHTKTRNGKTYTVRFFDPALDNARFHVKVFIWIENLELDKTHSIKIKGYWKTNNSGYSLKEKTWTANAIPSSYSEPTNAKMIDNGHYSFNGGLNSGYGPTWVGTNATADGSNYVAHESLTSVKEYAKGQTSYSNLTFPLVRTSLYETVTIPTEYVVSRPCTVEGYSRDVYFYKWHNLIIPCFPRAANVIAEGNKWNKTVSLSWSSEVYDSNKCITDGKWYVFRKNPRDNSVEIVGSEIAYNTHTLTDNSTSLDYGNPYTYYVCFVPNGWTVESWEDAAGLWASKAFTLLQEYQFKAFTAEGYDEKIELSWNLESFGNANNSNTYDVVLQRSVNNNTNWVDVYTQTINSSTILSGSYSDDDVSNPCTNYYYRLMVMAQDTTFYSIEKVASITGVSKVTAISASRGTYAGRVRIQWEAEQYGTGETYFTVKRRLLGSGDDRWVTLYTTNGTAASYNYQDDTAQPGDYYEYKVISDTKCQTGNSMVQNEVTTDGFCMARGVVSGRISYGTGTAVEGSRVMLKPSSSSGADVQLFYSLRLQGLGEGVSWPVPQTMQSSSTTASPYTIQFFLRPNTEDATRTANAVLLEENGASTALLQLSTYDAANQRYQLILRGSASGVYIKPNEFTLITLRYDGSGFTLSTFDIHRATATYSGAGQALSAESLHFGYSSNTSKQQFQGYLDEIRIYSRALPDEEIVASGDRTLAGNEDGLVAYIPLDEGVQTLTKAYDYSKNAGAANENHGDLVGGSFDATTPESSQFGLLGYTDNQGNYVVRGVPFNGDGTNYSVTPIMDSHEFSPERQSRYVSVSSLVHSGVDFTDISSFEVSGTIRYLGTNIPVDSVQISVDGRPASRNNEIVVTDAEGKFTVDVPIGRHYITASKDGHTFYKDGRIPVDPTGLNETTYEFVKPENGFTFWDNTLVPVAGRVVGGAIDGDKPLGFGQSRNTIGQARVTLEIPNLDYMLNAYEETEGLVSNGFRPVATDMPLTYPSGVTATGEGYRTGGSEQGQAQRVVITTDAATGEFAVLLPPLDYRVASVQMVNTQAQGAYTFDPEQLPRVDASHPATVLKDSIPEEDGGFSYFEYVASMKLTKHTDPVLSVRQMQGRTVLPEGVFGDETATYKYKDNDGNEQSKTVGLYEVAANGAVTYRFGYPIFGVAGNKTFKLKGYEVYHNYDEGLDDDERDTEVPLSDVVVTISNELSASQKVYNAAPENGANIGKVVDLKENQLQLDPNGEATYQWKVGLPNPQGDFTRTMNIIYDNGDGPRTWSGPSGSGLKAIIFGDLPDGNTFTTKGPDRLDMVLHDPYGDSSFATWESGKVTNLTTETLKTSSSESTFSANMHLGPKVELEEGLFVSIQTEIETIADFSTGHTRTEQRDTVDTYTTTIETSTAISTSADPDMVGADADIFIGDSRNLLFGSSQTVGLKGNGVTESVESYNGITIGEEFDTHFAYTQYQIENEVIPNMKRVRNELLEPVDNPASITNNGDNPRYVTSLSYDDENFGEEGTYTYLKGKMSCINMVNYYNESIRVWQERLADNEAYKLRCFGNSNLNKKNKSFGGGVEIVETESTSITGTHTISHTYSFISDFGMDLGATLNGVGVDFAYETHSTPKYPLENQQNGGETTVEDSTMVAVFSYTLADSGADDMFTIDIYGASNNHSPVFRTRGGQSSCPYEGLEVTKYYNPGTELSAATVQIEKPVLRCENRVLTGVPTGGKAQFELELLNNSGIDADAYFELVPVDGANPKGAKLSLPTGPIGNGRTVLVPAGPEPVKMILTLEQGNLDVTDYEDITLALRSTCQNDETSIHGAIKSEISLSAHFVPASTPVELAINKTVVNTSNVNEDVTLTVTGFDRNFIGLQRVDIQYMKPGATTWTLLQGYIPNQEARTDASQLLLPVNGVITLPLNMNASSWTDGAYKFRAFSQAIYGGSPVTSESEVLTLVKDVNRPQLFGLASPSDGVLNADDLISVTFNEDIQQAVLKDNNFVVSGVLNGAQVKHDVALSAQNTDYAAKTEASINLARKDFSADLWVRVDEAGDIFTHGNGDERFRLSVDDNNKLVVTIGNESYTSTNAIEKNTWTFLAFAYKFESGSSVLSARAVTDTYTRDMFANQPVADYAGTGGITLGNNFSGAIHELTLWDKAREMYEAQAEMHITKKPSTPNLIGYWKMDEGNGLIATDYARNRHLTLPNNTWYLNNDNKAVSLNGSNSLKLDIADCSALSTEDYAMEMWFKGDKAQNTAAATLFSAAEQSVSMGFSSTGTLTMTANGVDTEISKNDYLDNAWHHLALNVLHSGNATVYVDGKAVKTMSASAVPALEGTWLYVGSKGGNASFFKGTVDEIRFWKASMTGDLLSSQRTQRLTGEEGGLVAYYSFEKLTRDTSTGIISSVSTATDQDKVYNYTTEEYVLTGKEAAMTSGTISYTDEAPALKVKPEATNVDFTFVANERSIIINLDTDPDRVEGTTLNFNVRGVKDMNGNESTEISWTAFVKRNQLLWQGDDELAIEQQSGEGTTFEAVIENESGLSENWTLSGLPTWLTASATSGTLTAQSKKTITFTVSESTPIGKYEQTIYLTGNNNIAEPLTINLKVKGDEPDWAVNASGYQFTMSIVGQLQFQGKLSTDEDDIVAAFNEAGDCVGVARPQYERTFDSYFTMMTVYGNNDGGDILTFKAYDASTGKVYPVVQTKEEVFFQKDSRIGKLATPFIWNVTDKIEQTIDLKTGWNWMSLYVTPEDMRPAAVLASALDILTLINGPTSSAEYDPMLGWTGTLTTLDNTSMFKLNASAEGQATTIGSPADVTGTQISVKKGLTWIGYPPSFTLSPADAFAGLDPEEDDMVKSQSGFAVYSKTNAKWIGTLKTMEPGMGYMYSSEATASKTFTYPSVAPAGGAAKIKAYAEPYDYYFTPIAPEAYPGNMVMIGKVVENGLPVEGVEVAAFVDDECRATIVSDADGYVFLLVPGSKASSMALHAYISGDEKLIDLPLTYQTDLKLGTLSQPVMIDIAGMATSINAISAGDNTDYYDLSGRKLPKRPQQQGIYIRGKEKIVVKNK